MTLEYFPNKGFRIDSIHFKWGEERESVRMKLGDQHREDDRIIDLAQHFDGDESQNIHQRRDIYENLNNLENSFFLSYDSENMLQELEIHGGIKITIEATQLAFEEDIDKYVQELIAIDSEHAEIEEGNHLFKRLKLTISNSESNGGEGNGLSYFYASSNIDHLLDN